MTYPKGVDVASYQSTTFSTTGLSFVMVKATESTNYTNPKHDAQVAHARAKGMVVGHYHFVRAGSMSAQADYFIKQSKMQAGDLLALDWEDTAVSSSSKDAWLAYVMAKKSEHQTLLYCNKSFWLNRDTSGKAGNGLWIADPSNAAGHPGIKAPWVMHQYAIVGGLDTNVANFASAAALATWSRSKIPVPKPTPTPTPTPKPTPSPGGGTVTPQIVDTNPIGDLGTVDPSTDSGRKEYHVGYYIAHQLDEARKTNAALSDQTALLVEIRDALVAQNPAPAQPQTEHRES
jgi:hypothetical protein